MKHTPILRYLYAIHNFVTLNEDIIFVNGVDFLATLSSKTIQFSCEHIPTHTSVQIVSTLNKTIGVYKQSGFILEIDFMEIEFEKFSDEADCVEVNTAA